MSEKNILKPEEAAENKIEGAAQQEKRSPGKKKRKKSRVTLRLAVLLMIIALLFGVVVGYAVGRATGAARLAAAQKRIDELSAAAEEAGREEIDIFTENLSPENRQALADLSGLSMQAGGESNAFLADGFDEATDTAAAEPVVVAEYSGGTLMSDEVSLLYNERLTSYVFSGYTEEEIAGDLLSEVMQEMVAERVLRSQAESRGLTEITAADSQQIAAAAQAEFEERTGIYESFVYTEGMNGEEVQQAAAAFLEEAEGITLESIRAEIEADWWQQKLRNEIVQAVQPGPEDILSAYNDALSEQKERFSASAEAFEDAQASGETLLYHPSGYRAIRPLIIYGENAAAQAQEVLERLDAGESFESLLQIYGEDESMKNPALLAGGCYISAASTRWEPALVSAAMALQSPGQISGLVQLEDGACILQYVGDVQAGAVDMAAVYDEMSARALTAAQNAVYEAQKAAWMEQTDAKYYPERMQ